MPMAVRTFAVLRLPRAVMAGLGAALPDHRNPQRAQPIIGSSGGAQCVGALVAILFVSSEALST